MTKTVFPKHNRSPVRQTTKCGEGKRSNNTLNYFYLLAKHGFNSSSVTYQNKQQPLPLNHQFSQFISLLMGEVVLFSDNPFKDM